MHDLRSLKVEVAVAVFPNSSLPVICRVCGPGGRELMSSWSEAGPGKGEDATEINYIIIRWPISLVSIHLRRMLRLMFHYMTYAWHIYIYMYMHAEKPHIWNWLYTREKCQN